MLRRNRIEDDPGLSSLHRLEFYKRKKDWKLERDKSVQMESESAAEDSLPSSCELQDSSLARSCYFTSLLDIDMLSGSFLAHRSLENLTDELTFLVEARDRPHSSQLDVSMKRGYASVAAKTNVDIQSLHGTTVNQQCMDESRSGADQMADTAVSDQIVWAVPSKNRWNKHNEINSKKNIEEHKHIRYSTDTLHGLNQKYYGSRMWVNSSYSKIDETSVKSEEGSHRDGKTNDVKDKVDDCDAPKNYVPMSSSDVPKSVDEWDQIQDEEKLCENQIAMQKNFYPMYNEHNYSMQTKIDKKYAHVAKPKIDYPMQTRDDPTYAQDAVPKNDYPMQTRDDPTYAQDAVPKNNYPMQTKDDPMYTQVTMPKNDYPMQTKDDPTYAIPKNYHPMCSTSYPMQTQYDPYARVPKPKNYYPTCNHCVMQTKNDPWYDDNYPNICMQKYDDSDFIGYDCNKNIHTKHENAILSVLPGFDLNERQNVKINNTYAYPTNETNMFDQENSNFSNNYYEHPMASDVNQSWVSDDAAQFMWNNNGTSSFNVGHRYDQPNTAVNDQMPTKDGFGNSYQNGSIIVPPGFKPMDRFSTNTGVNDQMPTKDDFGNSYQNESINVPPGFKPMDRFSTNTGVNDQMSPKEGLGNSYQNGNINVPPAFKPINRFSRDINKISSFADVDKLIENPNLYAQMCPNTYGCPNENLKHIPIQMKKYQTAFAHYDQCNLSDQRCAQYECVNPSKAYLSKKVFKKTTLQYGDSEISYIDEYRTNLVAQPRLQNEAINSFQDRNLPHMYQAFPNQPQLWPVEKYDNGIGLGRGRARKNCINNPGYARYKDYPC